MTMKMIMKVMMTLIFSDIASLPPTPVEEKVAEYSDSLFYIYTSGTTGEWNSDYDDDNGYDLDDEDEDDHDHDHDHDHDNSGLPKAAIITHSRYLFASYCLFCMGLAVEQDVLYSGEKVPQHKVPKQEVPHRKCL